MLLLGGGRQSKDRYRYRLEQRKIVAKRIIVDQHNTNAPLISPLTKMPFPPYHIGFKKKKNMKKGSKLFVGMFVLLMRIADVMAVGEHGICLSI